MLCVTEDNEIQLMQQSEISIISLSLLHMPVKFQLFTSVWEFSALRVLFLSRARRSEFVLLGSSARFGSSWNILFQPSGSQRSFCAPYETISACQASCDFCLPDSAYADSAHFMSTDVVVLLAYLHVLWVFDPVVWVL